MGEKTEGKPGRSKFGDSGAIPKQSGSVSGIGIAECAEFFVVAREKRRTGVDAAADVDEMAIDIEAKLGHGVGFVDVGAREQLVPAIAEDFLRGGEELAVLLLDSGDVEEAEKNALGADADAVIEISGDALADKNGGNFSAVDAREDGRDGFNGRRCPTVPRLE